MLKSFINAKTGEKVNLSLQWEVTKEVLEEHLWMTIKWNLPIEDISSEAPKKRGRPKKEVLEDNKEE